MHVERDGSGGPPQWRVPVGGSPAETGWSASSASNGTRAVEPALIRRQTEPDGGEFAELLGKGRAAALLGPAGDNGAGGAECAGVVFDQVGVGLAEQDPAGGGAQVVAASWAYTVEVPLPNSAVTTDSSYTPPGRSWMRAPRGVRGAAPWPSSRPRNPPRCAIRRPV